MHANLEVNDLGRKGQSIGVIRGLLCSSKAISRYAFSHRHTQKPGTFVQVFTRTKRLAPNGAARFHTSSPRRGKVFFRKRALNPLGFKAAAWSRKLKRRAHYRIANGSVKCESKTPAGESRCQR